MELEKYFNAYVLSCREFPERLHRFEQRAKDLSVTGYSVVYGSHGDRVGKPNWWWASATKWACNLIHLNAIHRGISEGGKPILILEDDAYLTDEFVEGMRKAVDYFNSAKDPTVLYLAGKERRCDLSKEIRYGVFRPVRVMGAIGYVVSQQHAPAMSAYLMDVPTHSRKARNLYNDVKMINKWKEEQHASLRPKVVKHCAGHSIIDDRKKKGVRSPPRQ